MWARISTPNSAFTMCSIYHPLEPVYLEEDLLEFLGDTSEQITYIDLNITAVIDGDLNELRYKDLLTESSLNQLVKEPPPKKKLLKYLLRTNPIYGTGLKLLNVP